MFRRLDQKKPGMRKVMRFDHELKLIIIHDADENFVYTFDGVVFRTRAVKYDKNGKKVGV